MSLQAAKNFEPISFIIFAFHAILSIFRKMGKKFCPKNLPKNFFLQFFAKCLETQSKLDQYGAKMFAACKDPSLGQICVEFGTEANRQ